MKKYVTSVTPDFIIIKQKAIIIAIKNKIRIRSKSISNLNYYVSRNSDFWVV